LICQQYSTGQLYQWRPISIGAHWCVGAFLFTCLCQVRGICFACLCGEFSKCRNLLGSCSPSQSFGVKRLSLIYSHWHCFNRSICLCVWLMEEFSVKSIHSLMTTIIAHTLLMVIDRYCTSVQRGRGRERNYIQKRLRLL